jgi:hypothetical protein
MTLVIPDALSFFQQSSGRWRSQRSVHHLLHRRAEAGGSLILVDNLSADDPRLRTMAAQQGQDPDRLVGGSRVRWSASMAWDQEGEAHDGESVIGLIPDGVDGRSGVLLRDLGYPTTPPSAWNFACRRGVMGQAEPPRAGAISKRRSRLWAGDERYGL